MLNTVWYLLDVIRMNGIRKVHGSNLRAQKPGLLSFKQLSLSG